MRSNTCPKCQSSMTEGFILDSTHGGANAVTAWVQGAPRKSFWLALKIDKRQKFDIQTWRCGRCGFLESYARG